MARFAPSPERRFAPGRTVFVAVGTGVAVVLSLGGCAKSLFPPDAPRTQFELHDRIHNRYTPTTVPDVFGNPQPALRARLTRQY